MTAGMTLATSHRSARAITHFTDSYDIGQSSLQCLVSPQQVDFREGRLPLMATMPPRRFKRGDCR